MWQNRERERRKKRKKSIGMCLDRHFGRRRCQETNQRKAALYGSQSGESCRIRRVSRDQPEKSCTLRQPIRRDMWDKKGVKRPTREKLHSTAANQKRQRREDGCQETNQRKVALCGSQSEETWERRWVARDQPAKAALCVNQSEETCGIRRCPETIKRKAALYVSQSEETRHRRKIFRQTEKFSL